MQCKNVLAAGCVGGLLAACQPQMEVSEWVSSTAGEPWVLHTVAQFADGPSANCIVIDPARTAQTIDGFGTCFNELGWTSLNVLDNNVRDAILRELFEPGVGANFSICRMPIGANDFATDWYSYNETAGDFDMKNFSITHDSQTLIPFIRTAKQFNPGLRIWASPWSPPTWMKYNKHYAARSSTAMARHLEALAQQSGNTHTYMFKYVDNGLPEERQGLEGTDMFIQEEAYLKAYARYFARFIEAYRAEGIEIFGVMPQNEFNSAQIFPSCCWTAKGLARFIGQYLGPVMKEKGVEVMLGTIERPNTAMVDTILQDPDCARYITAVGFQWAGKDALPGVHARYPEMKLYQTEQECGDGQNDLKGAAHAWELMKHYLNNGTSVYTYWNTSLLQGGTSRWGWAQNSLVTVDETTRTFAYTPEYYVMKHASHYVQPGARALKLAGDYHDALGFVNPDKSVVLIVANQTEETQAVTVSAGKKELTPTLPAYSLNTLLIKNI